LKQIPYIFTRSYTVAAMVTYNPGSGGGALARALPDGALQKQERGSISDSTFQKIHEE